MSISDFSRALLGRFAAAAMLSGCGGGGGTPLSPSPFGGAMEQTQALPAYRVLYSFKGGSDGFSPSAALTNVNGTLYGTTAGGGGTGTCPYNRCGTVFSISAARTEAVLHSFKGGSADGADPTASLLDVNGTLYGTTAGGGSNAHGTVFSITTSGKEAVLYSFKGGAKDGAGPLGSLLNINGTLYGTTEAGGSGSSCGSFGCGTVFSITTSGKETVLHSFKGGTTDGQNPHAGLITVKGKLYGTTDGGGAHCTSVGDCGTVFAITRSGKETVLYSFKGGTTDGQNPQAALIYVNGKLYGTTTGAGANNFGTVFAVTTSGTETMLHSFGFSDGDKSQAALLEMHGKLYGTTEYGGSYRYGVGTIFEISTSGKERVLHSFSEYNGDGYLPVASLINVKGTLYGTTSFGGSGNYCYYSDTTLEGCGTVFALKP